MAQEELVTINPVTWYPTWYPDPNCQYFYYPWGYYHNTYHYPYQYYPPALYCPYCGKKLKAHVCGE